MCLNKPARWEETTDVDSTQNPDLASSSQVGNKSHWYTPKQLTDLAQKAGVEVTARQIEEWQKDGLLPNPVRTKLPGQGRGRAPYQYPDPSPDAVIWLGSHRRFIRGVSATQFWMWLEGFNYIEVNQAEVVLTCLQDRWAQVQKYMPSLPSLPEVARDGLSPELRDKVLDELDVNGTQPMLDSGQWDDRTVAKASLGASALGLYPPEYLNTRELDEESYVDLLYPNIPEQYRASMHKLLPTTVRMGELLNLFRALTNIQRPMWQSFREMWETTFTPEVLVTIWPMLVPLSPFRVFEKPQSRTDMLPFFDYDPVNIFQFMAMIVGAISALQQPLTTSLDTMDEAVSNGEMQFLE